jgi:Mor family transcriptional regulator
MKNIERFDLSRTEWERLIDDWIFNQKHRDILKDRLLNGIPFEPLAEKYNLSVTQVKNIVYKATEKLTKHL